MNINYNGGFIKNIIDAVMSDDIKDIIEDSIKLSEIALIDSTKRDEAFTKANMIVQEKMTELNKLKKDNFPLYKKFIDLYNEIIKKKEEASQQIAGQTNCIGVDHHIKILNKSVECESKLQKYEDDENRVSNSLRDEIVNYKQQIADCQNNKLNANATVNSNINKVRNQLKMAETQNTILTRSLNECESDRIQKNLNCNTEELKDTEDAEYISGGSNSSGKNSIKQFIRNMGNKISGGMIGQLKTKYNNLYEKELLNYKNLKKKQLKGVQSGGSVMIITIVVIKLFLLTVGNFIFDWWPMVLLISLYAVGVEYTLIKTSGKSLLGVPILTLGFACLCPCCWTMFRLFKGWENSKNESTDNLYHVLSNCNSTTSILDIHNYYSRPCEGKDCFWTTDKCYNSLYPAK